MIAALLTDGPDGQLYELLQRIVADSAAEQRACGMLDAFAARRLARTCDLALLDAVGLKLHEMPDQGVA